LQPALGCAARHVSAVACGPFSAGLVADGHLLLVGQLAALHGWAPPPPAVGGSRRPPGRRPAADAGPDVEAFSHTPVLALAADVYGPVTSVAVGGSHAAVLVADG
jgi:hypothetical protein